MDADALGSLLDRHAAALVLYARQHCACPEDAVQTALLKLIRRRTPPENLVAWLYRTVRHAALDASRAERRRGKHESIAAERAENWFVPPEDPAGLDARSAAEALQQLSLEVREVIIARLWGGLTFEEIAAALGGSAATCHRRFSEGLETLRTRLGVTARHGDSE